MSEPVRIAVSRIDDPTKVDVLDRWRSYEITLDMRGGSNVFTADMDSTDQQRALLDASGGQRALILYEDSVQFYGIVDERNEATAIGATDNHISGRSTSGLLIDSAIPADQLNVTGQTLLQLANRWCAPWMPAEIPSIVTNAAASRYIQAGGATGGRNGSSNVVFMPGGYWATIITPPVKAKKRLGKFGKASPYFAGTNMESLRHTSLDLGTKVLAGLQLQAEQIGAHVWQGADGALIIARPCYEFDHTAYGEGIVCKYNSQQGRFTGGNVRGVEFGRSIQDRASEYTVVSAVKSTKKSRAGDLFHTKAIKDPGPAFWKRSATSPYLGTEKLHKPDIIDVKRLANPAMVKRIARRRMLKRAVDGLSLEYTVDGHHAPSGALWVPDSMVRVDDDWNNIHDAFYISRIRRVRAFGSYMTAITLMPPDLWLGSFDTDAISTDDFVRETMQRIWW